MSDTQLINTLEREGDGCALVSDDSGNWAVVSDGVQNVPHNAPQDIQTTFFIAKAEWKPTVREALIAWARA